MHACMENIRSRGDMMVQRVRPRRLSVVREGHHKSKPIENDLDTMGFLERARYEITMIRLHVVRLFRLFWFGL
jgi:hypothetical protein